MNIKNVLAIAGLSTALLTGCPNNSYKYGWAQFVNSDMTTEHAQYRASQTSDQPDLVIRLDGHYSQFGVSFVRTTYLEVVSGSGSAIFSYADDTTPLIGVTQWDLYTCINSDRSDCHLWDTWRP